MPMKPPSSRESPTKPATTEPAGHERALLAPLPPPRVVVVLAGAIVTDEPLIESVPQRARELVIQLCGPVKGPTV